MAVANVDVRVDSTGAVRSLQQLDRAAKSSQNALSGLARQAAGIGFALVGGFAIDRVIRDVTELERNIRRLGTVGVDVAKIGPALSRLSADLGGVANAADLAAASYQAASAGFSDTAGNIQILNAAAKAAVGGLADTQAVTEVLVKTLNAYGMSGSRAFEVTDSISKAVELGNQEWSDYTALLGRVASTSALAGVSVDQLNAFIAAATKNGATAEVAFTGLSAVLNTLLQPTKESQEAAAKLGIAWNYSGLQAQGFTGLMADLAKAMDKDKETTARLLGSQEAMRGAFAANAKSGKDFEMILRELSNASGKTDADFQTMRGSLENTIKALDTSFQDLSAALVKAFGPTIVVTLKDLTKSVNGFANAINTVPQPVLNATGEIIKLAIQMALVKKAIDAVIGLRAAYASAMAAMASATAASGAAATGSASATALYMNNTKALAAQASVATPVINGLTAAMLRLAGIGVVTIGIQFLITQIGEITEAARAAGLSEAAGKPQSLLAELKGLTKTQLEERRRVTAANLANDQRLARELSASLGMQESAAMSPMDMPAPSGRAQLTQINARVAAGRRRLAAITQQLKTAPVRSEAEANALQQQLLGSQVGGGGGGGGGGADKAQRERERAAEAAREQQRAIAASQMELSQARALYDIEGRILEARAGGNRELEVTRKAQTELLRINFEAQLLKQNTELPAAQRKAQLDMLAVKAATIARQLEYDIAEIGATRLDQIIQMAEGYSRNLTLTQQLTAEQQKQKDLADGIANTIGQGMASAFDGLIQGTESFGASLRKIASGVLTDIANQLLRVLVINQAINAISNLFGPKTGGFMPNVKFSPAAFSMPSLLPGRATGGSVTGGQPYLVGERGPELFMPGRSGGIAPSGSFGGIGNVVVNVDATGSSAQGDSAQANKLGEAIGLAVRQELIKQKRPGGLIA